jgi:hypothetical protein
MSTLTSIDDYKALELPERFAFFEHGIHDLITNLSDQELYSFFKGIVLDRSENENIRKNAVSILTNCVLLGRIKIRQALNVLLDEWITTDNQHLESQRLKDLFFFYEEDQNGIETLYKNFSTGQDAELVSESCFRLGLINFQKGLACPNDSSASTSFQECSHFFNLSFTVIENRVDAQFFFKVASIVENITNQIAVNCEADLESLASILFELEVNSIDFVPNLFYVGIYNSLVRLSNIRRSNSASWLDIRTGLTSLFSEYSLLQNQILKDRLYQSQISELFVSTITTRFVEPFFMLNLKAEIARIDSRLLELNAENDEKQFLRWLRDLISDEDHKKKVELTDLKNTLSKFLPHRTETDISQSINKISDLNNPSEILHVYLDLMKPSIQELVSKLVSACIKLQGTLSYRSASEDDRNSYISNLLEAYGYYCKDQTKWGKSATGKLPGEIDILILDLKKFPIAIVEALNLDSLQSDYLILHLDKLFNYDSAGHALNFILVYSTVKKFGDFWDKYKTFVSNHNYKYSLLRFDEIEGYEYTNLRIAQTIHSREQKEVILYHIMVDLQL